MLESKSCSKLAHLEEIAEKYNIQKKLSEENYNKLIFAYNDVIIAHSELYDRESFFQTAYLIINLLNIKHISCKDINETIDLPKYKTPEKIKSSDIRLNKICEKYNWLKVDNYDLAKI